MRSEHSDTFGAAAEPSVRDSEAEWQTRAGWWRWIVTRGVGPVAVLIAWEVAGAAVPSQLHLLPAPTSILHSMWHDAGLYRLNVGTTAWEALQGFVIGAAAAITAGVVVVQVGFLERYIMRVAVVVRALPLLAVAPVLVAIFSGESSKVIMAALVVFFPMLIAAVLGLKSPGQASADLVRVFGGGRRTYLQKVRLSASLPWMFTGLVVAAPSAVVGAILGEFFGGNSGIGVSMLQAMTVLDTDRVWGLAIAATVLSGLASGLLRAVEHAAVKWEPVLDASTQGSDLSWNATGWLKWLATVVGSGLLVLVLWDGLIKALDLNSFFAKSPSAVGNYLFSGPGSTAHLSAVLRALSVTVEEAAYGFIVGTVLAVVVAIGFVLYPRMADALMPVAIGLRAVPVIAIVPLLIALFGRGLGVTLAVTMVLSFFPTLVNMCRGLGSAPPETTELLRSYDAGRVVTLIKLQFPYSLAALFASMRVALLESILGALVAEWLATGRGLGQEMTLALANSDFSQLWAAAAAITLASVILYGVIGLAERPVLNRYAPNQVS